MSRNFKLKFYTFFEFFKTFYYKKKINIINNITININIYIRFSK